MPNLKAKIDGNNKKLENTTAPKTKLCNCLKKENCAMRGACLTENVLHYIRISCEDKHVKRYCTKESVELLFKNVMPIKK